MANFVELVTSNGVTVFINLELVRAIRPSQTGSTLYFDAEHTQAVQLSPAELAAQANTPRI